MATDYDQPRNRVEDEEPLEEVRSAVATIGAQSPNIDEDETAAAEKFELPGADLSALDLSVDMTPLQADEFTCRFCFLVRHRSQRVSPMTDACVDCA